MPDIIRKARNLIPPELLSMIEQKTPSLAVKVKDYLNNAGCFHEVYVREVTLGYIGQPEEELKHRMGVLCYDVLEDRVEYSQELLGWIDFSIPQSLKDSAEENAKGIPYNYSFMRDRFLSDFQ